MCRHFAYLGPSATLATAVYDAPHALVRQSYAPTDMRGSGTVSVDGFGVGWYRPDGSVARYRRPVPIWQDASFADLARHTSSTAVLGAVRGATPGMSAAEEACAPFTDGRWLFSLNGFVHGWPDTAVPLASALSVRDLLTLEAPTDAALLWAVVRSRVAGGDAPADALGLVVATLAADAPGSRLTTLLTDGRAIYATTGGHTLWSRAVDGAVTLASEPFDEHPSWRPIADGQLVVADSAAVTIRPLTRE